MYHNSIWLPDLSDYNDLRFSRGILFPLMGGFITAHMDLYEG
jgi:hypothetical protein